MLELAEAGSRMEWDGDRLAELSGGTDHASDLGGAIPMTLFVFAAVLTPGRMRAWRLNYLGF